MDLTPWCIVTLSHQEAAQDWVEFNQSIYMAIYILWFNVYNNALLLLYSFHAVDQAE